MGASERSKTQYCRGGEAKPSAFSSFRPSLRRGGRRSPTPHPPAPLYQSSLCVAAITNITAPRAAPPRAARPHDPPHAGGQAAPPRLHRRASRLRVHTGTENTPSARDTAKAAHIARPVEHAGMHSVSGGQFLGPGVGKFSLFLRQCQWQCGPVAPLFFCK